MATLSEVAQLQYILLRVGEKIHTVHITLKPPSKGGQMAFFLVYIVVLKDFNYR